MRTISFQPWHLAALELGAEERRQYARSGTDMFAALSKWRGPAWSLIDDRGRLLGCFGMLVRDRTGVLWAVLSDEARDKRFGLHRAAKRQLAQVESTVPLDHILAAVRTKFRPGHQWIKCLGFAHDGDFELGNERYERYAK